MEHTPEVKEAVELHFSCRELKTTEFNGKGEYRIRVFQLSQTNWILAGETEKINNNPNPDFKMSISLDFVFETKQPLIIDVLDTNKDGSTEAIGSFSPSLGEILGARKHTMTFDLHSKSGKPNGHLIIRGDLSSGERNEVVWHWSGVKLMNTDGLFGKSDPFLRFFKENSGDWIHVYETEFIKNNLDPVWKPFRIDEATLCGGDYNKPFRIECWDNQTDGKHRYIGVFDITLERLKNGENTFQLYNAKKKKETGTLKLLKFDIQKVQLRPSTILNYVREGGQLNTIVAIDFTHSNGNPQSEKSLHAHLPHGKLNEYQQVITAIGQILLSYDHDQQVSVYGFGASLRYETLPKGLSHCFPCSGIAEKPQVHGLAGVMDAYRHALENIELNNPTHLALVVGEAVKIAKANKQSGNDIYTVLFILCDNETKDMKETTKILAEAAELPLSVIMVGVGSEDFFDMKIFNENNGLGYESGEKVTREFVKFVRFGDFKSNVIGLTKHALVGIPGQLESYIKLTGKIPTSL